MEYFGTDYAEFSSPENNNNSNGAHFTVDDLLDFSKEEDSFLDGMTMNSGDSSTVPLLESCNSSIAGGVEAQFPANELCIPYDDELEWLSNFIEESFSTEDLGFIHAANASTAAQKDTSSSVTTANPSIFPSDVSVPGKARSKRSRAPPCDWSSRLLHITPTPTPARKCLHCQSEKTPQWRTGPMGPKTLCNACGVRYKSGRLVPEYRPAASPTFISNNHSNSHRKVLELRRQKELRRQQQTIGHVSMFNGCDGFLIHHQNANINGQDSRHVI